MLRGVPLIFGLLSLTLGLSALILTFDSIDDRERIEQLFTQRETVLSLADELRQSSDDLSRFARSYAATTDARFWDRFRTVLAIREGELRRPSGYQYAFWDLETVGELEYVDTDDGLSIQQRLVDAGVSSDALSLLNRAKKNSDGLAKIEEKAFGYVEDGRQGEALEMLFGDSYHRAKADIMRPIRNLQKTVDHQTRTELESALKRQRKLDTMIIAALLGALIFGTLAGLWRRRRVTV